MHPKDLLISDYTYHLPGERIAKYPLPARDASKLLIYHEGKITEDIYRNLADHLPPGALLVFNNTKVIEARLLFQKATGGIIEIFCLEPHEQYKDITAGMLQTRSVLWQCLVGGVSKWKRGQVLEKRIVSKGRDFLLRASYVEKKTESFIIEFSWTPPELSFAEVLHYTGVIPLPPYIKRIPETSDEIRYQTIYAAPEGSVAAPTAGLHFTQNVFNDLRQKKIFHEFVTLHVGAGTFKPVKTPTLKDHEMHEEFIDVSRSTLSKLCDNTGAVISVGTTSLRTLESLYWLGVRWKTRQQSPSSPLLQWEVYDNPDQSFTPSEAIRSLLDWMDQQQVNRLLSKTGILIAPGYTIRMADALITNFHQPQSTLLLLIAAIAGQDWKKIYDHALNNDYRFLSYGDGSLVWVNA
jgi:S-adenosylmethionine:tRNA ribosyltransferase-isomerase